METQKQNGIVKFAKVVERVGNKLPHPMYIFIYLIIGVMVLSAGFNAMGVEVTYNAAARDGTVTETTVAVVNLFSREAMQNFLSNVISAYQSNAMMIPMLVCAICMSVAEETEFFQAALRKALLKAPRSVATYALCVIGICCNIASDAGMILAPAIGAVLFKALGRNPWIGIGIGYGASAAGFTANILPTTTDALLSGISGSLAEASGYTVHAMSNYIFLFVATFVGAAGLTVIGEKFIAPLCGDYEQGVGDDSGLKDLALTDDENRGLKFSLIGFLIFASVLFLGCLPMQDSGIFLLGFFRSATGDLVPSSPLMSSIVPLIGIFFLSIGIPYAYGSRKVTKKSELPPLMKKGVVKMAELVFIIFPASLFVYQFNASGLSTVASVSGEKFLSSVGLNGFPMLACFIIIIAILNIFMYSGSAKWMIMAPIFIPMFANMGIHPAITQLAYRIGDSTTNNLTPLNACLLAALALMERYRDPELNPDPPGIGTILATQLPVSIGTCIVFSILLGIFMIFGLPVGFAM